MLRSTRNEFFIGFTISVILSLFANFTLLIRRYNLMMAQKWPAFLLNGKNMNYGSLFSGFSFFLSHYFFFIGGCTSGGIKYSGVKK